ncbi:hypothetical protein QR680_003514 [Steinernema hermaphroditum]|uniref:G-protein coupled receptors family 1 profile domain-containing protein n=1 Tax=Steinernema hermaphroditum TaxID=289476 RepID=A0AA39HMW0_9BILA|nr:hypothetical protein QR680_003514 [Steinernema hermaphroditum]
MAPTTPPDLEVSDEGDVSELCMTVVKVSLLFFGTVGVFGNANIIIATVLNKSLKSKCGLLLALLGFCDLWCLLFELLSAVRLLTNSAEMSRKQCFWSISFYLFIENIESYMIFAVGVDRFMAVCSPVRYRLFRKHSYILYMTAPGFVYTIILMILGIVHLNDATVPVCNPPMAYPGYVSQVWNISTVATCGCTVIVYIANYIMIYKIAPIDATPSKIAEIQVQKIIIKTLTINVMAYASSSILSAIIILIMRLIGVDKNAIADAETYAVIPGLLSYSVNYYVYFWRSSEYRKAFKRQLLHICGSCQSSKSTVYVVRKSETYSNANRSHHVSTSFSIQCN